jgi:hypothetical protein
MIYYNKVCFIILLLFLSGCVLQKKVDNQNNNLNDTFVFSVVSSVENLSQDDAKLLGFIFLPFALEEMVSKKNDNFYIVDNFYAANMETFESSYQLLKKLYIQDGWALVDEIASNLYRNAFFKKQNKEMVVFIQENEIYDKKKKFKKKQILLHQSLLLT